MHELAELSEAATPLHSHAHSERAVFGTASLVTAKLVQGLQKRKD